MSKKKKGPLKLLTIDGDELNKKVEKCCTETQYLIQDLESKGREKKLVELSYRLQQLEEEVNANLRKAQKLKSEDEPVRVDRFDKKKENEIKRGEKMKDSLVKLLKKLDLNAADGDTTEESKNKQKRTKDELDDDEDKSEGRYAAVKSDAVKINVVPEDLKLYKALADYAAEVPEDLSFKAGEILSILSERGDGWLEAKNAKGDRGMVPSSLLKKHTNVADWLEAKNGSGDRGMGPNTLLKKHTNVADWLEAKNGSGDRGMGPNTLLKKHTKTEDDDDDDDDVDDEEIEDEEVEDEEVEEEESEEEGYQNFAVGSKQYEAIIDFVAEMPDDLSFKAGEILIVISARDDGWLEAKNAKGDKGMVPSTFLKERTKTEDKDDEEESEEEGNEDFAKGTSKQHKAIIDYDAQMPKDTKLCTIL